jgi:5S rRNA maturation endonuclease (ribonuclease M5)
MLPIYQPGDAAQYCSERGWQHKVSGDELILEHCPYCQRKSKFYLNNLSGAFQCFSAECGRKGNFYILRRDLGDPVQPLKAQPLAVAAPKKRWPLSAFQPYEQALLNNVQAMAYLQQERGLTLEAIQKWHLGLKEISAEDKEKHEIDLAEPCYWLMIPYLTRQQEVADVTYRTLPPAPKRFTRKRGADSILFGDHLLPEKKVKAKELYLVEGELDAITLDQYGFGPVLSTTTGAASFSPRWYDLIAGSGAKDIYVVYDSDIDGQAGAEKLVKKFTDDERTVYSVVLPDAKDSNEYFLTHSAEDFRTLLKETRPAEMEYVLSPGAVLDRLEEQIFLSGNAFNGIPSQFQSLNQLMDGGYGNGFLITAVAPPGAGKTTFAIQELLKMGEQNMRTYLCCLELPEEMLMRKVINHLYHIPMNGITQDHIHQYRADIERRGMYVGRGPKRLDVLIDTFRKAIRRFDLKCVAFDNIHYFVRSSQNEQAEIGLLTKALKDLAMEMNIPIIALGQPIKFNKSERIIDLSDIKNSGSIEQDSDNIILMWRPTLKTKIEDFGKTVGFKENMSPLTLFRVAKSRYSPGGETLLYLHGALSTFRELSDDETKRLMEEAQ